MSHEKKIFNAIIIIIGLIISYSLFSNISFIYNANFDLLLNWRFIATIIPLFFGLAGIIIFSVTKFKRSGLLKAFMCYNVFIFPFFLLGIKFSFERAATENENLFRNWTFGLNFFLTMLLLISCCIGLWLLSKNRKPLLAYITIGGESFAEFSPAPKTLRFVNRLLDLLIIIYVLYTNIVDNYYLRHTFRNTGTGTLLLIEFVVTLYYYVFLEGVFNTSVGKSITATMVVDDEGRKPGLGKIIGRTICRYIPFEPYSFLGKEDRGWHDTISGTYVVKAVDEDKSATTAPDTNNDWPLQKGN